MKNINNNLEIDNKKGLTDYYGKISEINKLQEQIKEKINIYIKTHADRVLECGIINVRETLEYPDNYSGHDEEFREELFLLIHRYASLVEQKINLGFGISDFESSIISYSKLLTNYNQKLVSEEENYKYKASIANTYMAFQIEWFIPELFGNFATRKINELALEAKSRR